METKTKAKTKTKVVDGEELKNVRGGSTKIALCPQS